MLEIIAVMIAIAAIINLARGRGVSAFGAGFAALAGYVLIAFIARMFVSSIEAQVSLQFASWTWLALSAAYLRFVHLAAAPQPDSEWSCSNCHYFNSAGHLFCAKCQCPWHSGGRMREP
jgi:hypothetical protein